MADNKTLWTWGNQQKYHTEIIEELDKKLEETDLKPVALSGSYNDLIDTPEIISTTAVLSASEWTNNSQTVLIDGVTASNTVIVSPAPSYQDDYISANIKCIEQSDGSLTFNCGTIPTTDITVNVVIL